MEAGRPGLPARSSVRLPKSDLKQLADALLGVFENTRGPDDRSLDIERLSVSEAYETQKMFIEARLAKGEEVVGYKVGCTSRAIREQFGLSEPICGRLMAPHVYHGDVTLSWDQFCRCAVEPELVLVMGRDLTDEVADDEDLIGAIDCVSPGIEVHNYTFWFGHPTLQELIASNGIHACLVVGGQKTRPGGFDWDMEGVGLFVNGELATSGIGAEIMGGPLTSLRWLVNHLVRGGDGLRAGQLVIPGSAVKLRTVEQNDRVASRFTNVGRVEAVFQ